MDNGVILRRVQVCGEGKAKVVRDKARLTVTVKVQHANQKSAVDLHNADLKSVLAIVSGFSTTDLSTLDYHSVDIEDYGGKKSKKVHETLTSLGLTVDQALSNELREALNKVPNTAVQMAFTASNSKAAQEEAVEKAIVDAESKAVSRARRLNVKLSHVISFEERVNSSRGPVRHFAAAAMGGGAENAAELPAGEEEVSVTVTLSYLVEGRAEASTWESHPPHESANT